MPGKQMAVDAELNSGLINEDQAKKKRKDIAKEADLRRNGWCLEVIRGDALAGIIITVVNILGILIGMVQVGLSFSDALQTYTVLTIEMAWLVSYALIVSGAAGLLITRVPEDEAENWPTSSKIKSFGDIQPLAFQPLPYLYLLYTRINLPFLLVAVVAMALVFDYTKKSKAKQEAIDLRMKRLMRSKSKPFIDSMLVIEPLLLELGVDLVGLVDEKKGGKRSNRYSAFVLRLLKNSDCLFHQFM